MKTKLEEKLNKNKELLAKLIEKQENLERQRMLLEQKIENQEFTLKHLNSKTSQE